MAEKTPEELRAIDARIAVDVMGWCRCGDLRLLAPGSGLAAQEVPAYTRDIAHAWSVVDELKRRDPLLRWTGTEWMCVMNASDDPEDKKTNWHGDRMYSVDRVRVSATHESAPMAIVLCAIAAIEAKKGQQP